MYEFIVKSLPLFYKIPGNKSNWNYITMTKTYISFFLVFLFLSESLSFTQEKENLYPSGHGMAKVYTNFHKEFTYQDYESAFEVTRAYLGYVFFMDKHFSAEVKLDIGSPDDESPYSKLKRYAFFKNAALEYRNDKLIWNFGIISLKQFKIQEKYWNHRYIYKSFQDEHRFGASADIGTSIEYRFTPWLTADVTLMNGEGYNQLQIDNTFKSGFGASFYPSDFLIARIYYDIMVNEAVQQSIASFIGIKKNELTIGLEYNYKTNISFIQDHNIWGYSVYGSYNISDKWEIFGRFDRLLSKKYEYEEFGWNFDKDGSALIAGVQYQPIRYVKFALNYHDWYPFPQNIENHSLIYLNLEFILE